MAATPTNVWDTLARIHEESGYMVSRHSDRLRQLPADASAEVRDALYGKIEEDIETYCIVTSEDKRRLVKAYTTTMNHSAPQHGCAACDRRDRTMPADAQMILEGLREDHWLRCSAEARAEL